MAKLKNLDLLIPQRTAKTPVRRFAWATVTKVSPLRIRMDGEGSALRITPISLVSNLVVGQRVWVQFEGRRAVIIGSSEKMQAGVSIPQLVGVQMYIYGDSYTQYAPPEATPGPRIARRYQMLTPINRGVSGTKVKEFYERIEATWTPNSRGLVVIGCTLNNEFFYPATTQGYVTGAEAFRACLAYLSCRDITTISTSSTRSVVGPGWTQNADSITGSSGAYVDLAWNSNELDVFLAGVTGSGGTIEFRNEAGTLLATANTGNFYEAITTVVTIPSQGSGVHTVRATVTSGTVTLRRMGARASTPPLIVWDRPGLTYHLDATEVRAAMEYKVDVAESFPNVIISNNDVPEWDRDTMISADNAHRNDEGNTFATQTMEAALRAHITGFTQGLNAVDFYNADEAHSASSASYTGPGAAVPNAPVLTATASSQVKLSWTRPTDNGSTLTGYRIERSPAGAGTWTLVTTISGASTLKHTITTGLTPSSSYDFRVRAINGVGDSAWSATSTATAGAAVTLYGSDTFDRANDPLSPGSASVGGAWTGSNASWGIRDNYLYNHGSKSVATRYNFCLLNTGQAQGYVEVKLSKLDSVASGVALCMNAASAATQGMVLYAYAGTYRLAAYTSADSAVTLATYAITPQDGDVIGIYHDNLNYTAVINGVAQTTFVGTANYLGTRHGAFSWSNGEFENFQHTNANPLV